MRLIFNGILPDLQEDIFVVKEGPFWKRRKIVYFCTTEHTSRRTTPKIIKGIISSYREWLKTNEEDGYFDGTQPVKIWSWSTRFYHDYITVGCMKFTHNDLEFIENII